MSGEWRNIDAPNGQLARYATPKSRDNAGADAAPDLSVQVCRTRVSAVLGVKVPGLAF